MCEIFSNLVRFIEKKQAEADHFKENPLQAALIKKELLDTLRVRAYRHKHCCNNFLDSICLQNAYYLVGSPSKLIEWIKAKKLIPARIEDSGIFVFGTPALFNNREVCTRFCQSNVNTTPSLMTEKLLILNEVHGVEEQMFDGCATVKGDSILSRLCSNSPKNQLSIITKSIIEIRHITHEFSKMPSVKLDQDFRGINLKNNGLYFSQYRDRLQDSIGSICQKLIRFNCDMYFTNLDLLEKNNMRDELERSVHVAAEFLYEFLIEVPVQRPFLQGVFEEVIASAFPVVPNSLEALVTGRGDPQAFWFSITHSLEIYNSLLALSKFTHPEYFRTRVGPIKEALRLFEAKEFPSEHQERQLYIIEEVISLIAKLEGTEPKFIQGPKSVRFPDQSLLESKGYWITASQGSTKKLLYKCFDQRSRRPVMIKRLQKAKLHNLPIANGELGALMTLNHANIVMYLDCFEDENHCFMVMEFCEDTIMSYVGGSPGKLPELEVRHLGRQILNGIVYLHQNHIVHRDIKPGNILKDGRGFIKIADFGEAQLTPLQDDSEKFDLNMLNGTAAYMAPECLHKAKVYPSADMWSFGCVLLYMISGLHPWSQCKNDLNILYTLGATDELPADIDSLDCSQECKSVLKSLLQRDPTKRPGISELYREPFFHAIPDFLSLI